MNKTITTIALVCGIAVSAAFAQSSPALTHASKPQGKLQVGDVIALCGDSSTDEKVYTVMMEEYFLMCLSPLKLRTVQLGLGKDLAGHLVDRIETGVLPLHPTIVTTSYGLNDGGRGPMTEAIENGYRTAIKAIVQKLKAGKVRQVVVGSSSAMDLDIYNLPESRPIGTPAEYNRFTLSALRDIGREVATEEGVLFANILDVECDLMVKEKAKYGKGFRVGSWDGIHQKGSNPQNGQMAIAYTFLKALGCDGDIGTITLDLKAGKAEATAGHKILASQNGAVEVESSRYPFCFFGDPSDPYATTGAIEFLPFNEDLNRFLLVVKNPGAAKVKVTWGNTSKVFTSEQVAKGINLAAEFLDNPFGEQFKKVGAAVLLKQWNETGYTSQCAEAVSETASEKKSALVREAAASFKRDAELAQAVAALVVPVKHTIQVEAVKGE